MNNALATLTMANLAKIVRGEPVPGLAYDTVGAMYDDDDDDMVEGVDDEDDDDMIEGLDDADVGAIADTDIGALTPAQRRARKNRLKTLARLRAKLNRKKKMWKGRKILPVDETSIAAGATETIVARPNHLFKPQRLIIEPTNITDFAVQNIVIRGNSQFEATGTVPASVFAADAADANFVFDTCPSNSTVDMQVTNTSAGALTFRAAFLGLYR